MESQQKDIKIDDNIKNACKMLQEWLKKNGDKQNLFEFINSHILHIYFRFLKEEYLI